MGLAFKVDWQSMYYLENRLRELKILLDAFVYAHPETAQHDSDDSTSVIEGFRRLCFWLGTLRYLYRKLYQNTRKVSGEDCFRPSD